MLENISTSEKIQYHRDEIQTNLRKIRLARIGLAEPAEKICELQDKINASAYAIAALETGRDRDVHWKTILRDYGTGEIRRVEFFYGGRYVSLAEVYAPHEKFGSPRPAEINWKATGSQEVEYTKEFIHLLKDAVEIADSLNEGSLK